MKISIKTYNNPKPNNGGGSILFLGYKDCALIDFLISKERYLVQTEDKINLNFVLDYKFDFLVSYGYRYIVSQDILNYFHMAAINLHISYLPWNRGSDPNLWSFIDNTKKGVSIHYMDKGLDTGDIIAQKEIQFDIYNETFSSSYERLHVEIQKLFKEIWDDVKIKNIIPKKQTKKGSYHSSIDKNIYFKLFDFDWNTKIHIFLDKLK